MCADGSPRPLGLLHPAAMGTPADMTPKVMEHRSVLKPIQTPAVRKAPSSATPGTQSSHNNVGQQTSHLDQPTSSARKPVPSSAPTGTQHQADSGLAVTEQGQMGTSVRSAWTACGPHFSQIHQQSSLSRPQQHGQMETDDSAWIWDSPTHRGAEPAPSFNGSFQVDAVDADIRHGGTDCQEACVSGPDDVEGLGLKEQIHEARTGGSTHPSRQGHADMMESRCMEQIAAQHDGHATWDADHGHPGGASSRQDFTNPSSEHCTGQPMGRRLSHLRHERRLHPSLSMQTQPDDPARKPGKSRPERPQHNARPAEKRSSRPNSAKSVRSGSPRAVPARPQSALARSNRFKSPLPARKSEHQMAGAASRRSGRPTRTAHAPQTQDEAIHSSADHGQDTLHGAFESRTSRISQPASGQLAEPLKHSHVHAHGPSRIPKPLPHTDVMSSRLSQAEQQSGAGPPHTIAAHSAVTWVAVPASRTNSRSGTAVMAESTGHQHVQRHDLDHQLSGGVEGKEASALEGAGKNACHQPRGRQIDAPRSPEEAWLDSPGGAQDSSHSSGTCWPAEAASPDAVCCHPFAGQHDDGTPRIPHDSLQLGVGVVQDSLDHGGDGDACFHQDLTLIAVADPLQQLTLKASSMGSDGITVHQQPSNDVPGMHASLNPELTFAPWQMSQASIGADHGSTSSGIRTSMSGPQYPIQEGLHQQLSTDRGYPSWHPEEPTAGDVHEEAGSPQDMASDGPRQQPEQWPSTAVLLDPLPVQGPNDGPQGTQVPSLPESQLADVASRAFQSDQGPILSRQTSRHSRQRQWWLNDPRLGDAVDQQLPYSLDQGMLQGSASRPFDIRSRGAPDSASVCSSSSQQRPVDLRCDTSSLQHEHTGLTSPRAGTVRLGFPWSPELWKRMGPSRQAQPSSHGGTLLQPSNGTHDPSAAGQ